MSGHPADRVPVKEVCVVLEGALKFGTELVEVEGEIKLRRLGLVLERCHDEVRKLRLAVGRVLQHEDHLDERAVAQIPAGLYLLGGIFKWQVLMRVCAQGCLAD